jgi:hypothetical protein
MKSSDSLEKRLTSAFRHVLCREPTDDDAKRLRSAYEKQVTIYKSDLDAARALIGVGAAPSDDSLNAADHAALTAVCLGILNLDEAVTRE